jgi:hypothetical protein|tara:strand:+ start:306 stop:617 length:312 start_codon:yes stop_codon:yes gene_type:complete
MKENKEEYQLQLLSLLKETNERLMTMIVFCERLQPVKLKFSIDYDNYQELGTVDLTDEAEMMKTKLFRLDDEMFKEDQTGRSICEDLRKNIRHLEEKMNKNNK